MEGQKPRAIHDLQPLLTSSYRIPSVPSTNCDRLMMLLAYKKEVPYPRPPHNAACDNGVVRLRSLCSQLGTSSRSPPPARCTMTLHTTAQGLTGLTGRGTDTVGKLPVPCALICSVPFIWRETHRVILKTASFIEAKVCNQDCGFHVLTKGKGKIPEINVLVPVRLCTEVCLMEQAV